MIDTTKFLPRRTEKKSVLSEKTVINFRIIKKDFKRIDDTLKERLVLSKVRAGILREQSERMRRRENENTLEKRKEDDGTDFDPTQEPKKRGNQGLLTTLFAGLIGGIGFVIVKAIPLFKTIFKTLSAISRPIVAMVRSIGNLITGIRDRLFPAVNDLQDKEGRSRKDIKDLPDRVNQVGNQLQFLANAMVFNTVLGMIFTGVGAGKVKGIMNVARSKKLLTAASAVKLQKQLVVKEKVARTTAARELVEARDMVVPRTRFLGGEGFQEPLVGRKITKSFAKDVQEGAVKTVEQGVKAAVGGIDEKITPQNFGRLFAQVSGRELPPSRVKKIVSGSSFKLSSFAKDAADAGKKEFIGATSGMDIASSQFASRNRMDVLDDYLMNSKVAKNQHNSIKFKVSQIRNTGFDSIQKRQLVELKQQLLKSGIDPIEVIDFFDEFIISKSKILESNKFIQLELFDDLIQENIVPKRTLQDLPDAGKRAKQLLLSKQTASTAAKTATRTATKGFSKQVLRQTLGAVPLLGDLAVLLLDIYVFKEIPARAGFKTIGSILGSVIGGLLGGLAATATGGTGAILIPALTILGSIGGDILGGILYDFLDRSYSDYGPFKKPDSDGKTKISDVGRAGVSGAVKGSTIGKVVKDAGGVIKKGSFVNKGGDEFLFDNDTYMAFNKAFPGLLETANSLEGDDSISAISERLSYEKKGRRLTRMIPIPIPEVSKNASQNEGSIMTNKKQEVSMLAMNTQTLYRRS